MMLDEIGLKLLLTELGLSQDTINKAVTIADRYTTSVELDQDHTVQDEPKAQPFPLEVHNGVFNMIVHLCNYYSSTMPPASARAEVANWLEQIVNGLRNVYDEKIERPQDGS